MTFPRQLYAMQQIDMESDVSYQEIKRAVWDCGVDKSSRPDGFTFGFIRRFRSLLEKDAYSIHSPHSVNEENMNDVGRNGVDVVVPVESIRSINEMFTNTAY
nr:RNA-directed DNA polymerase, eukaryota, reverse transcriptase zinc-binding domain protein [Tanacetum cinerariifolium]